ncbi:hypothetical protein J6590_086949 [Homalodisca vitripennis]|nr:hypothetical protein J6590_086949 [Homalodisca vitripennis]
MIDICETKHSVFEDGVPLQEIQSTTFLGMYLDQGPTWNNNVDHACAKIASAIFALRNLVQY